MEVSSTQNQKVTSLPALHNRAVHSEEQIRRQQIALLILLVIVVFQMVDLLGAVISQSMTDIWTGLLGLVLCGAAFLFTRLSNIAVVSVLLIIVVDLGCGVMILLSPMGLDVANLPVFDVLLVSELIAVSILPVISVFPIALVNILFIIGVFLFQHRTPEMKMMMMSSMAFNMVAQPIVLQIVVAIVSFIWVRSALNAIARADRAEELAALQRREAERQQREIEHRRQLDEGVEYLSQVLVHAANGQDNVRAALGQDNALWRIGNAINLLLTRWRRANQAEQENMRLRAEVFRLSEALYKERAHAQQQARSHSKPLNPSSQG
jgi:hypothetical protein